MNFLQQLCFNMLMLSQDRLKLPANLTEKPTAIKG